MINAKSLTKIKETKKDWNWIYWSIKPHLIILQSKETLAQKSKYPLYHTQTNDEDWCTLAVRKFSGSKLLALSC